MPTESPPAPVITPPTPQAQVESPSRAVEPLPTPSSAPKPGSARERMLKETAKKWGVEEPQIPASARQNEPSKAPEPVKTGDEPNPANTPEGTEPPKDLTPEQKKQNPWKLYREEQKRAKQLEQQIADTKASSLAETERAEYLERIEKLESSKKQYEDEIRFKSYEKSEEFKNKYEAPYEAAWTKHMHDLEGINITDEQGNVRPVNADDVLALVNLPLADAKKLAKEKWGDFTEEAMMARKEIRDTFEAKNKALDEARKTGAEREKQFKERSQKWQADTTKAIKETWDGENQRALNDPVNGEFFKSVEGDDTRNQLLGKGFALVDRAFSENAMDPKLKPEDRVAIVKRHAAVRNRAAAFGPMKYLIHKLQGEIAELKKANGQFKESQPSTAGGTTTATTTAPASARARMQAAGEKYAR